MENTIFEKTAGNGMAITVYTTTHLDSIVLGYTIDGTDMGTSDLHALVAPNSTATHYLTGSRKSAKAVGFTAAETAIIAAALQTARDNDPATQMAILTDRRDTIVCMINAAEEEAGEKWDTTVNTTVNDPAAAARSANNAAATASEQLAAFDAAHPEVIAAVDAARAERLRSFEVSN